MNDLETTTPGDLAMPGPQPSEPTFTNGTIVFQFLRAAEAPDTWTADAVYPADSPVPYTLAAKAETLLGAAASRTALLPIAHACDMRARDPQADSGPSGQPDSYVTEISVPPSDGGIHRPYARTAEPEPEPEAGL
jgi:hypothetical protein